MNATEISLIKNFLIEQKSSILNKSYEFKNCNLLASEKIVDEIEAMSNDLNMNISIHLHMRDRLTLEKIEHALGRISDGTFGQCESCLGTIALKRLRAHPFSTLCIECMEDQEDPRNNLN